MSLGGPQLPWMWLELVNERIERFFHASQALDHQGVRAERRGEKDAGVVQAVGGDGGRHGGAVHQGQALFGMGPEAVQPEFHEHVDRFPLLPLEIHFEAFAEAQQCSGNTR